MKQGWALAVVGMMLTVSGCMPGYIKSNELEAKGQGPTSCAKACEDIGMRMTAMVLVGDTVPGCVCQTLAAPAPAPAPAPAAGTLPAPGPAAAHAADGAAASTGGYILIAAAAAARQQQEARRQQEQQRKR